MARVTLDHRRCSTIILDTASPPIDNLFALNFYRAGITRIVDEVREMERTRPERIFPLCSAWSYPATLPVQFDWFAVTVCNYLRLVGLIGLMNSKQWHQSDLHDLERKKEIRLACRSFVKEANPWIYAWRNKVSAHAAMTDPFDTDNIATLVQSLASQPAWNQGRISIGQEQWCIGNDISEQIGWSITYEFDRLAPRFWPDLGEPLPADDGYHDPDYMNP
jgi:hypothetical protein